MTELDRFLPEKKEAEGEDQESCIQLLIQDVCNDAYFTYHRRIPVPELQCKCMDLRVKGLKPTECRGDCSNNRPFLAFELERNADILNDFECNVEYSIIIGGETYVTNRVVSLCLPLHDTYVLIYLDQPNMPNEIVFSNKRHYLPTEVRRRIVNSMNPNGIIDGTVQYMYGMARRFKSD